MALAVKSSTVENVMTTSEQTEEIVELQPEETKAVVGGAERKAGAPAPAAQPSTGTTVQGIVNPNMGMGGDKITRIKSVG